MPEKKTDKELSIDELKDVAGGISWELPDTQPGVYNLKGEKKSKGSQLIPEDGVLSSDDAADIHAPTTRDAISGAN